MESPENPDASLERTMTRRKADSGDAAYPHLRKPKLKP
jgi:hypothetical protein